MGGNLGREVRRWRDWGTKNKKQKPGKGLLDMGNRVVIANNIFKEIGGKKPVFILNGQMLIDITHVSKRSLWSSIILRVYRGSETKNLGGPVSYTFYKVSSTCISLNSFLWVLTLEYRRYIYFIFSFWSKNDQKSNAMFSDLSPGALGWFRDWQCGWEGGLQHHGQSDTLQGVSE